MNWKHNRISYRRIVQGIGKTLGDHALYINMALFGATIIWLYVFVMNYYVKPKNDFLIIASKTVEIYDVTLDLKKFNEAHAKYKSKQNAEAEVPRQIKNPF